MLMKKIFTSLLLLLGSVMIAHADELKVAGVTVDLSKDGYVTGSGISGSVYYRASEKRLDLTDATINTNDIGIKADVSPGSQDFRIYLSGKNKVKCSDRVAMRADNNVMFCGNGDLELSGPGVLVNKSKMTVYACRLTVKSTGENGIYSFSSTGNSDLTLAYHGALSVTCTGHALAYFNDIKYTTGQLLSGSPSGTSLIIGDKYYLQIGGTDVNPFNRDNVTGANISGSVSVELMGTNASGYSNLKVTLNNAKVTGTQGIDYMDKSKDIYIALKGTNTISVSSRGLTGYTGSNCGAYFITGSGSDKLTVTGNYGVSHQGNFSVKDCILDITGATTGISLWKYGKLIVDNATLHAKSNGNGAAIKEIVGVEYLKGCTETEPLKSGYNSSLGGIASKGSNAALLNEVTIEPTYGIIVCGQIIKKSMGTNPITLTGNGITGKVTYEPKNNYLVLNNGAELGLSSAKNQDATVEVLGTNADIGANQSKLMIWSQGSGINKIVGSVSGSSAIYSANDIEITGNAPLEVESRYMGLYFQGDKELKLTMTENLSIKSTAWAVCSTSSNPTVTILPTPTTACTYRFWSSTQKTFSSFTLKCYNFSILAPTGASYSSTDKNIMLNGEPVKDNWVVFGNQSLVEDYGLQVGNIAVTSVNAFDPTNDGTFKYVNASKTLSVYKTYQVPTGVANAITNKEVNGLNLVFENAVGLTGGNGGGAFVTYKDATIKSNTTSQVTLSAGNTGINAVQGADVTIDNVTMRIAKPGYAISAHEKNSNLTIKSSKITMETTSYAVSNFSSITLDNCHVESPAGGGISKGFIVDASGQKVANAVIALGASGIEDIEMNDGGQCQQLRDIYDAAGRQLGDTHRGLNIVRMKDGSVRKVMVK